MVLIESNEEPPGMENEAPDMLLGHIQILEFGARTRKKLHSLTERLECLGSMEVKLKGLLKPLNTIVL